MDNNFIEKITGLDFLENLVWLDLSFNKITRIDGLGAQKNLQVLALYQNEIKVDIERNQRIYSQQEFLLLEKTQHFGGIFPKNSFF